MQVVVVSEDARLRGWLGRTCADEGWSVRPVVALDDLDGLDADGDAVPDLVLTDARPDDLRREPVQSLLRAGARVVVVTTRRIEGEVEDALEAGADSHITCPVGTHELTARLRAVGRRPAGAAPRPTGPEAIVHLGDLALDRATGRLTVGHRDLPIAGRELEAIEILMVAAPDVVTRDELVRRLWRADPAAGTLDVLIRRVRMRLEAEEGWRRVDSVRGVGFRLLANPPAARKPPSDLATGDEASGPVDDGTETASVVPIHGVHERSEGPDAIVLDPLARAASVGGRRVRMPRREFQILEMLLAARGDIVSRDDLVRSLWASSSDVRTIDVHVRRLRARLEGGELARCIHTVRGVGFRLDLAPLQAGAGDGRRPFTASSNHGHGSFPFAREGVQP